MLNENPKIKDKTPRIESNEIEKRMPYEEVTSESLHSIVMDPCSTIGLEFIDLYSTYNSLKNIKDEKLMLVESLKENGFKIIDYGRGNWEKGPRIISITLSNEKCNCIVDKLYYNLEKKDQYKVTERINCNL